MSWIGGGIVIDDISEKKVTMFRMAQIGGCSSADYSAYEHEQKEFDPEVYRKCKEYLNVVRN